MATFMVKAAVWDSLNPGLKQAAKQARQLRLGEPAVRNDGIEDWYVWDDHRISARTVATWTHILSNRQGDPVVPNDEESTMQDAADANGGAGNVRAGSIPESWITPEVEL